MTYFQAELNKALEAIERVRALHYPSEMFGTIFCPICVIHDVESSSPYPCPTIQALDGEPNGV